MVSWFYYPLREVVQVLFRLLTRYRVRGRDNIPSQGPLLVVANHLSVADPPLLGISIGRKAGFMAKEELFRFRPVALFLNGIGVFPIGRGRLDRKALHKAEKVLQDGWALAIFPEGRRSRSGRLRAAHSGPALIASHVEVPILPVGIIGTERIKGLAWLWRRPEITVNIGPTFYLPSVNGRLTKQRLAELTDIMMGRIAQQLPLQYHGHYAERKLDGVKD